MRKCQYSEFFWFAFSHIWTEYGDLVRSPYSVRMRENADLKNFEYGHFLRSVKLKQSKRSNRTKENSIKTDAWTKKNSLA